MNMVAKTWQSNTLFWPGGTKPINMSNGSKKKVLDGEASKRDGKTSIFLNRKLYGVEQGNLDWRIVPEDYKRNIVSIQSKSMENLQWS